MRLGVFIQAATSACAVMGGASPVPAEVFARFDIWVEAPPVVQSGDTVDVRVWAQLSGPVLDVGLGAMAGFSTDLPILTSPGLVSAVEHPEFGLPYFYTWAGEVSTDGLFDVGAHQPNLLDVPIFINNPILLYTARMHTDEDRTGVIELLPQRHNPTQSMILWWVDVDDPYTIVTDTDPNAELHIVGRTIRVVPGPASLALLAFAGLGAMRGSRRMTGRAFPDAQTT